MIDREIQKLPHAECEQSNRTEHGVRAIKQHGLIDKEIGQATLYSREAVREDVERRGDLAQREDVERRGDLAQQKKQLGVTRGEATVEIWIAQSRFETRIRPSFPSYFWRV